MSLNPIKSYKTSKEADEIIESSESKLRRAKRRLEGAQEQSKKLVDLVIDTKSECVETLFPFALDTLSKCQRVNNIDTPIAQDVYLNFSKVEAPRLRKEAFEFKEIVTTGVKGTTAGAALALGSMSAVSSFGAASTGTAIATLSGAAARNATMAWFGGGSLSAGGAGMAGGALTLSGIALAPILIVGAFKYGKHAEKKMTSAIQYRNKVREAVTSIDAVVEVASQLNNHIQLYHETLSGLALILNDRVALLDSKLQINAQDDEINNYKLQVILLVKAIKKVMSINVIDDEQKPTRESQEVINHASMINSSDIERISSSNFQSSSRNPDFNNESLSFFWEEKRTITLPNFPTIKFSETWSLFNKDEKDTILGSIFITPLFFWLSSFLINNDYLLLGVFSEFIGFACIILGLHTLTKERFETIFGAGSLAAIGYAIYKYFWVLQ